MTPIADSHLDVVIVRPADIDDSDAAWSGSIVTLNQDLARAVGNPVNILEVGANELERRIGSRSELWRSIRNEGIGVYGDTPGNMQSLTK